MSTWSFEPGHTEAEFRARHMMVTWVPGRFRDIHGRLELHWERCLDSTFEGEIDATKLWSGEPDRDDQDQPSRGRRQGRSPLMREELAAEQRARPAVGITL